MNEIVERVARAAMEARYGYDSEGAEIEEPWLSVARAAIAAMREASFVEVRDAYKKMDIYLYELPEEPQAASLQQLLLFWRAMIDEALRD